MHLMYYTSPEGKRVYTLKKESAGKATISAHPARFSPDDKFSRQRVTLKKRCVVSARGRLFFALPPLPSHPPLIRRP